MVGSVTPPVISFTRATARIIIFVPDPTLAVLTLAVTGEGFLRGVRQRKITRPTKCIDCELKAMCGMCPANGELENGDPEAPVDLLCRVAHVRAYAFGLRIGNRTRSEIESILLREHADAHAAVRINGERANPAATVI